MWLNFCLFFSVIFQYKIISTQRAHVSNFQGECRLFNLGQFWPSGIVIPHTMKLLGVYWFHFVCPFVRLSVPNAVSTLLLDADFMDYIHMEVSLHCTDCLQKKGVTPAHSGLSAKDTSQPTAADKVANGSSSASEPPSEPNSAPGSPRSTQDDDHSGDSSPEAKPEPVRRGRGRQKAG